MSRRRLGQVTCNRENFAVEQDRSNYQSVALNLLRYVAFTLFTRERFEREFRRGQ
jgi:hypothetical protein